MSQGVSRFKGHNAHKPPLPHNTSPRIPFVEHRLSQRLTSSHSAMCRNRQMKKLAASKHLVCIHGGSEINCTPIIL